MENQAELSEKLLKSMTKDFIERISQIPIVNSGVFQALKYLCKQADIWELEIILMVAETDSPKFDVIIDQLSAKVSKSTLYRKLNFFIEKGIIIRDQHGLLSLADQLVSLKALSNLKNLRDESNESKKPN